MEDRDKRRWQAADEDGDGSLNKLEFKHFLHPEETDHMRDIVISETLDDIDKVFLIYIFTLCHFRDFLAQFHKKYIFRMETRKKMKICENGQGKILCLKLALQLAGNGPCYFCTVPFSRLFFSVS